MDILEDYYGAQTFTLYALFAVVPGKRRWPRVIFVSFSVAVLFFLTTFQVIKLVIEKFQLNTVIEIIPSATAAFGTLLYVPYVAYATEQEYKVLLTIMLNDLHEERTAEEEAIKREYAKGARLFINTFTVILIATICGIPLSGLFPRILDLLIPLNETRQVHLLASGEIFIDQEVYFYYLYFLESCAAFAMSIVIGISENMSVIIGQHICGMCAIIGHRLENVTKINTHKTCDEVDYVRLVQRCHMCVEAHQKLLRFAFLVAAFYDIPLTLIVAGSFCTLTVSLVQVTDPQLISMKMVIFTVVQFFQLFLVSRMGQNEIDATTKIAENAYYARWDICPPSVRKILQLVILRSSRPCLVVARSMYTLSIENFMSVIQTVTSFYMVLRQAQ